MGYDCTCYLEESTKSSDVDEFLQFLGYSKLKKGLFYYFENKDYLSISGVLATINISETNQVSVYLRSQIFASNFDIAHFNKTALQLRKRFGGYFVSDFGKNRYIRDSKINRVKAEAGCYQSYTNFENNITTAKIYTEYTRFEVQLPPIGMFPELDKLNPEIISNNLVVPFLVSLAEEYFRSSYIALLKYSDKRESIIKNSRIYPDDFIEISEQTLTIDDAVARSKSFQNISKIAANFSELDKRLDVAGVLKKPYRRRKETLYTSMDNLFEQRHEQIHRNQIRVDYTRDKLQRDIDNLNESVNRSYLHFLNVHNWSPLN
jgi:hypothetical protein